MLSKENIKKGIKNTKRILQLNRELIDIFEEIDPNYRDIEIKISCNGTLESSEDLLESINNAFDIHKNISYEISNTLELLEKIKDSNRKRKKMDKQLENFIEIDGIHSHDITDMESLKSFIKHQITENQ